METKNLFLVAGFLLSLVISLTLAYGAEITVEPSSVTFNKQLNETQLIVGNNWTDAFNITIGEATIVGRETDITIVPTPARVDNLSAGSNATVTLTYSIADNIEKIFEDFGIGIFSTKFLVTAVNASNASQKFNTTITAKFESTYCLYGETGSDLIIKKIDIRDRTSGDNFDWGDTIDVKPMDSMNVEIKVKNTGDDKLDVVVSLALYDAKTNDFIELNDDDVLEEDFSLDDRESKLIQFDFNIPVDIEDGKGRYFLVVKAYEEDEEESNCVSTYEGEIWSELNVEKEKHDVAIDMDEITMPTTVNCGEAVDMTLRIYNIGENDEDKVKVEARIPELDIVASDEIEYLDAEESETVTLSFNVPEAIEAKSYRVELRTYYKYDEDDEVYKEWSDEPVVIYLDVGYCKMPEPDAAITAELLTEEAIAGKEASIRVTITNTGDKAAYFNITTEGIEDFAVLDGIEPESIYLQPGQSADVYIYMTLDSTARDENTFTVIVAYDNVEKQQEISLYVKPRFSFTASAIRENIQENWQTWMLGILVVVLIVLILVALRKPVELE